MSTIEQKTSISKPDICKIREFPKAETHVHFLGTILGDGIPKVQNEQRIDWETFLNYYFFRRDLIPDKKDIISYATDYIRRVAQQGVIHIEVTFAPPVMYCMQIPLQSVLNAFQEAFMYGFKTWNISGGLIIDLVRDLGPKHAMYLLEKIIRYDNGIVCGVGLGGDEKSYPPVDFKDVFAFAKLNGYKTSVHVGEQTVGCIEETIEYLKPDRLEHATNVLKESKVVVLLSEQQIPITVCLTSNEYLGVVECGMHPIRDMFDMGLSVSLHTDNPGILDCNLISEYIKAYNIYGFTMEEIGKLAENSISSSFYSLNRDF